MVIKVLLVQRLPDYCGDVGFEVFNDLVERPGQ
jgi:hypothetical protein